MLQAVDFGLEAFQAVLGLPPEGLLEQNRAVVHLLVHQVDGDAAFPLAAFPEVPDAVGTGELGQQRGVDIEDSIAVVFHEPRR